MLDRVLGGARDLRRTLAKGDQQKLDEYLALKRERANSPLKKTERTGLPYSRRARSNQSR